MQDFRKSILNYFKHNAGTRKKIKELARHFNIRSDIYPGFRDTVKALEREGQLQRFRGSTYGIPSADPDKRTLQGKLDLHPRGYAFVHSEDGRKFYIAAEDLASAAHADLVEIALYPKRNSKANPEAYVLRVIRREKSLFLCKARYHGDLLMAKALLYHLPEEILIRERSGITAHDGDHIMVEIVEWKSRGPHIGRVVSIVGPEDVPEFDALLVANKYNLPNRFSLKALEELEDIDAISSEEIERRDLTALNTFTIDPEDARDFDDALSIERDASGNYILGVHIADLSHYLPFDSLLDREARARGCSVYFTDYVIHMLPEKLSADLCSLKAGEERLCMSILMQIDKDGNCLSYEIFSSKIRSRRRFTYEEVQSILDARKGRFYSELSQLSRVATLLRKKRMKAGSIDFDLPEPEYILDKRGVPESIKVKARLWSHHIVEECMLLANKNVTIFARSRGTKLPFIFRVHEAPEAEDIYEWFNLMGTFGIKVPFFGPPVTSKKFQNALEKVLQQNKSSFIIRSALRTLPKAKYSIKPLGHFGLAFEDYSHFTSPIRRYPDLMVQRLLKYYIREQAANPEMKKQLNAIAKSSSEAELRALEAEREYHKIKQMRYIREHVGSEFEGFISGVSEQGFWVELEDTFIEGFVHRNSLPNDIWDFDKRQQLIKGFRTRMQFRPAQKVRVRVIKADVKNARADFILADSAKD